MSAFYWCTVSNRNKAEVTCPVMVGSERVGSSIGTEVPVGNAPAQARTVSTILRIIPRPCDEPRTRSHAFWCHRFFSSVLLVRRRRCCCCCFVLAVRSCVFLFVCLVRA